MKVLANYISFEITWKSRGINAEDNFKIDSKNCAIKEFHNLDLDNNYLCLFLYQF